MDLFTAALALIGSEAAKKIGGKVVDEAWARIKSLWNSPLSHEPKPEELTPEQIQLRGLRPALEKQVQATRARSSALRRAELVSPVLQGARLLWVDNHPRNNAYECRVLAALGVKAELATATDEALLYHNRNVRS